MNESETKLYTRTGEPVRVLSMWVKDGRQRVHVEAINHPGTTGEAWLDELSHQGGDDDRCKSAG